MSASKVHLEGRDHRQTGRLEDAEASCRQAIELDPSSVQARLSLGMVLIEMARLPEATEVLGQLVVDHPGCAAGWVQLARSIVPQGFNWEAHGAITKALKAKPDAETLVAISMLQVTMGHLAAAESTCRRAVKLMPRSASAWMQLGQILAAKGKPADAAAAYQRALAIEPQSSVAAFFLAALHAGGTADVPVPSGVATAPSEYVRGLFDGIAHRFDGMLVGSLKYRTPQLLDRIFSQWRHRSGSEESKPLEMLDAGCGTGLCGLWMARYRGHLIGVDLSRGMLAEAQLRGVYDELVPAEIAAELQNRPDSLDLIVAADVVVYIGDLQAVFTAAATALRAGGVFLLSVESTTEADYLLLPTQRFAHSAAYLNRLAAANGLIIRVSEQSVLRLEKGADVRGQLFLVERESGRREQPDPSVNSGTALRSMQ